MLRLTKENKDNLSDGDYACHLNAAVIVLCFYIWKKNECARDVRRQLCRRPLRDGCDKTHVPKFTFAPLHLRPLPLACVSPVKARPRKKQGGFYLLQVDT